MVLWGLSGGCNRIHSRYVWGESLQSAYNRNGGISFCDELSVAGEVCDIKTDRSSSSKLYASLEVCAFEHMHLDVV